MRLMPDRQPALLRAMVLAGAYLKGLWEDDVMQATLQALALLVTALVVLLFFGPIVAIVSIVGALEIGSFKLNLRRVGRLGRTLVGLLGLAIWAAVYVPLIVLATQGSDAGLPATPTVSMTTPSPTLTGTAAPTATIPAPALLSGTYLGRFSTSSYTFAGVYSATIVLGEDGVGVLTVQGAGFYDGPLAVRSMEGSTVVVSFSDAEDDRIEATLVWESGRLYGPWHYATGALC